MDDLMVWDEATLPNQNAELRADFAVSFGMVSRASLFNSVTKGKMHPRGQ